MSSASEWGKQNPEEGVSHLSSLLPGTRAHWHGQEPGHGRCLPETRYRNLLELHTDRQKHLQNCILSASPDHRNHIKYQPFFFLFQAQNRLWTLYSGTWSGRTCLRWRLKVLSTLSSLFCCSISSSFAAGVFKATPLVLLYRKADNELLHQIDPDWTCPSMFRPWWVTTEVPPLGPEDEDVAKERERVINGRAHSDILTMINLSKVWKAATFWFVAFTQNVH